VSGADDRRYPRPDILIDFLTRHREHGSGYVAECAAMIRRDYPGSADDLLPRLRAIYADKRLAERKSVR
jgi:hypothetical protein